MNFFHKRIAPLCIFLLLYTATFVIPEGFAPGTAVHTPTGFTAIEQLQPGDEIVSFDLLKRIYAKNRVVQRQKQTARALLHIHCGNTIVKTDEEQRFLDADTHTWHPAHALRIGQRIVAHDQDALTITDIQHKKFKQACVLYALSLHDNPHNFCVTKDKIVAHNFEPVSTITALYTLCSWIYTATQVYAACHEGNSTASNLCEEQFQQLLDRNPQATLGDLTHDQSSKVSPAVVDQCIEKYGSATKLRDLAPQELKLFDEKIGVQRALQTVKDQEQKTHKVSDKSVQNAKTSTSGTASTLKGATASGAAQGAINGTVQGIAQLGIAAFNGDVISAGGAIEIVGKSIITNSAKNGGKQFGKAAAITACKKVAPELTKEILKRAPIIQQALMIYTIVKVTSGPVMSLVRRWTGGDDDGKGSGAMRLPAARALMHYNDNASGDKQPKSSGSGTPTPPKDPDKDNKIKELVDKAFETYKRDPNKDMHLFDNTNGTLEKHGFDILIKELITEKIVPSFNAGKDYIVKQLLSKVVENGFPTTPGSWETVLRIGNYNVTIRTIMVDGALVVGTAFIRELFKR